MVLFFNPKSGSMLVSFETKSQNHDHGTNGLISIMFWRVTKIKDNEWKSKQKKNVIMKEQLKLLTYQERQQSMMAKEKEESMEEAKFEDNTMLSCWKKQEGEGGRTIEARGALYRERVAFVAGSLNKILHYFSLQLRLILKLNNQWNSFNEY